MKYHKENLHCVYLFKEAQKCYAKLTSSYEKIQNWLMTSGLFVSDINIKESGSVRGTIEAANVEVNGHVEGKISADSIIVGKSAVIKGDIFFKNTNKTR